MEENLDLVLNTDIALVNDINIKGFELLEKNAFFKDLTEIMTDKKFSKFYNKYFKTMDDIKSTVIYMKLFNLFKEKYNNLSQKELSNCVNVYLLHKTMTTPVLRTSMISATIKHLENNKNDILEIVNSDLKNKKLDI